MVRLHTWLEKQEPIAFEVYGQTARISNGRRYCSGILVTSDLEPTKAPTSTSLVLTCAHFFRAASTSPYYARGRGFFHSIRAVRTINGTDIALALMQRPSPVRHLLGVGTHCFYPSMDIATLGYGGNSAYPVLKPGSVVMPMPLSFSRGFKTRVRPAAIQMNSPKVIKGDSGGAVLSMRDGDTKPSISAVQSLVLDPLGINLGLATVAPIARHKYALYRAAQDLLTMR